MVRKEHLHELWWQSGKVRVRNEGLQISRGAPPTRLPVARIDDVPGGRRTTTWEVDHVMWQAGRALPA